MTKVRKVISRRKLILLSRHRRPHFILSLYAIVHLYNWNRVEPPFSQAVDCGLSTVDDYTRQSWFKSLYAHHYGY